MKNKVLFIITQSEFGGAQRFLYNLVTNLDKSRFSFVVAAGPEKDDKRGLLFNLEKIGIKTHHLEHLKRDINLLTDLRSLFEIRRLISQEKPDIVFLGSSKAGLIGSLATKLVPGDWGVIYRIGGWAFNDPRPRWQKFLYKFAEKISAKWKDIIIVNAECHRKQAIELGIKPRKEILTIYNGIDANSLKFLSREEARKSLSGKYPISIIQYPKSKIIGTIANLYPAKGLEHLIKASYKLRATSYKLKFIVIGEGRERPKLENLIKKYNLENNFFLLGEIPDAYKYLKAFDIFVLSSVKEGFPWTILEAMVAGVPIIATRVGAVPEILENPSMDSTSSGQAGLLVKPGDAGELSEAIIELINNPSSGVKLAEQSRKIVEERFTLKRMVGEIEELLI